ncbi:MAG: cell division protein SepF [Olegusella sp.]|nr:cell division protein SepF [Olegusella sp.]
MGFFDNLRDRISSRDDDGYYDDQDYDDDYYDEAPVEEEPARTTLLGNSRRPEPESVSVYTRSGRPLGTQQQAAQPQAGGAGYGSAGYRSSAAGEATPRAGSYGSAGYGSSSYESRDRGYESRGEERLSGNVTPGDIGGRPIPRSGRALPPYVLKPAAYDDVQMVVRRVRTNQPVVLVFRNTNIDAAKRILDFCFGLSCGIGGAVQELGDRVFVVLPADTELSDADIDKLIADGDLVR